MRHKIEIFQDVTAAAATALSTDHSRALSGAEWLQQLASELVAVIKAEAAPQKPQDESPGEGWRWLEPGEKIKRGDQWVESVESSEPVNVSVSIGCTVSDDEAKCYRRRI